MLTTDPPPATAGAETRARTATLSGHRMHALYEAHRAVTTDLSLPAMLNRIVAASAELFGTPHVALALLTEDGGFGEVLSQGDGRMIADRILADTSWRSVSRHVDPSAGPVAAVPLQVRGEPFAMLVLSSPGGRGFDADDQEVLDAFAAATATAVENARLYDDARRSRDWLNASGEIARALLADADDDTLLDVVSRALYVAEADTVSLVLPTADDLLQVTVTVGVGSRDWEGVVFDPHNSLLGRAITRGESMLIADLIEHARAGYINSHRFGPTMLAPLIDAKGIRGAVILLRMAGRPRFTPHELDLATTFADQVALAFELNDMRAQAEALRALEQRHRIAQNLHDNVIQRLFATGVGLQGLANSVPAGDTATRLRAHIADLDATIDEIRDHVFGLRAPRPDASATAHHQVPRVSTPLPAR